MVDFAKHLKRNQQPPIEERPSKRALELEVLQAANNIGECDLHYNDNPNCKRCDLARAVRNLRQSVS